jgi:hypothetical protein
MAKVGESLPPREERRKLTACSAWVLWSKFCHVVDGVIDDYPYIFGDIVLADLLNGNKSCHGGES